MGSNKISEYRKCLFALGQELTSKDFENMKFLCHDLLTARDIENINSPLDLFVLLEQRNELTEGNCCVLQEILAQVKRRDLVTRLVDFQENGPQQTVKNGYHSRDETDCVTDAIQPATTVNKAIDDGHASFVLKGSEVIMLRDVNAEIYERLAFLLNPKSFKSWLSLAGHLGYTQSQVANFKLLPMQSTQLLLEDWAQRPDATVIKLYKTLTEIERYDAARVLEPILAPGTSV